MKRVYLSFLIIFATVISVMGLAYAYFTSNAVTMTGITLATGSPSIQIKNDQPGAVWGDSIIGAWEENMYPGWTGDPHNFYLKNTSTGMIIAKIIPTISGTPLGDWGILKSVVEAQFIGNGTGTPVPTGWETLEYWQTNIDEISVPLPGDGMSPDSDLGVFSVQYRISTDVDSSGAEDTSITNMEWSFIGRTQ